MEKFGINIFVKNKPMLDPDFIPIQSFNKAFLSSARVPVSIAIERSGGQISRVDTYIHATPDMEAADKYYLNRLVKTALWMKGGFKIHVSDADGLAYKYISNDFCKGGAQDFDFHFMAEVFEQPFEVLDCDKVPSAHEKFQKAGGSTGGCRIGFDAGGSDRKVSAVVDGECVFSEEVVWNPKTNENPDYHYEGIVSAFKSAAEKMERVDAIGISSAGIYINNRTMRASLFIKVPEPLFNQKVKDIYIRAVRDSFGDIPFVVYNDGDVSAIAGMMSIGEPNVLGIAMGTSEAAGFVNKDSCITGWLNELAFAPVDAFEGALIDEWSGDIGCGCKYFSQDAVIKLAPAAGIDFEDGMTPAQKLKKVQTLLEGGSSSAADIFTTIGTYLGHTLSFYHELYDCRHVLLLGRVMSGKGGDIILSEAKRVLTDEYPEAAKAIIPSLPDEKFRRLGQSVAAASLPVIN